MYLSRKGRGQYLPKYPLNEFLLVGQLIHFKKSTNNAFASIIIIIKPYKRSCHCKECSDEPRWMNNDE